MTVEKGLFDHLVLDAAPLLTGNFASSLATNFYTTPAVISEIRDEASRLRLAQLPFKLHTRTPSLEALAMVNHFARVTGDVAALSATDLQVIALVVTLELECNADKTRMRRDPAELPRDQVHVGGQQRVAVKKEKRRKGKGGVEVDSFDTIDEISASLAATTINTEAEAVLATEVPATEVLATDVPATEVLATDAPATNVLATEATLLATDIAPATAEDEDDGEWITPDNLAKMKEKHGHGKAEWTAEGVVASSKNKNKKNAKPQQGVRVACITSDFAMQNVLLQMRLELYTPDGCRVRRLKNWLLRCHACYCTTHDMTARFCSKCGGPTLIRTSYAVDETGACRLFLRDDFQYNLRGTKYSIPIPKGGHAENSIILREDQKEHVRQKTKYDRVQRKLRVQETNCTLEEALDDRLAAVFSGAATGLRNKTYDQYDGLTPPVIGHGRRNPNVTRRK